ncbi:Protein SCAF8 [Orchesella cincta]|uniref:Protein SCAF8 n=1 Tax=Orchesella cincta TaxID=48709 RepID=A0A1D2MK44_ORCCI|nr:Protein SCAF8 [Orchesella cincta]
MSSDMEAVNSFNAELQSLYDVKPPISKGKMTSITRAALKAVKLYKHAVQSVEKFIQKCKSEYKIPGLYVIDSIIRQSRHQFGAEKDVFAPRFARNIQNTFVHLYRCPEEDKAKVIRVLNLWQKNHPKFQPELGLGRRSFRGNNNVNSGGNSGSGGGASGANNNSQGFSSSNVNNMPAVHFNKKLLDFDYGEDDDGGGGGSNSKNSADNTNVASSNPGLDALGSILSNPEILRQLQTLQETNGCGGGSSTTSTNGFQLCEYSGAERQRKLAELSKQEAAFDQRLAETVATVSSRCPTLPRSEVMLVLAAQATSPETTTTALTKTRISSRTTKTQRAPPSPFFQQLTEQLNSSSIQQTSQQQQLLNLFRNSGGGGNGNPSQNPFSLPLPFSIQGVPPPFLLDSRRTCLKYGIILYPASRNGLVSSGQFSQSLPSHLNNNQNQIKINQSIFVEEIDLCDDSKEENPLQLALLQQQRSGERGERGRSKRSRSHDRHKSGKSPAGSRTRRSRSRSRDRTGRKRYRSRSRERREEREKEKERVRKGLPVIKKEHLSVCSTTLWVGHLSKLVNQEEISDTFGAYGDVVSIDLIPPRGCAFIVMNRRQDAVRALDRLKNTKLQGKTITLAWAPGKGVKGKEWKDYWEVGDGVSYIPWNKLRDETNLEEFEDGGCMDEDTLPEFLKNKPQPPDSKSLDHNAAPPLQPTTK